jgi:hypothetical protein
MDQPILRLVKNDTDSPKYGSRQADDYVARLEAERDALRLENQQLRGSRQLARDILSVDGNEVSASPSISLV